MDNLTFRNSLVNLLNKNNVTASTYDISAGLKERVQSFKGCLRGGYKQPLPNILYPVVYVELNSKQEDFALMGKTARKDIDLNYIITPVIDLGYGNIDGRTISDDDLVKLSDNIETLLRNFPALSITGVKVSNVDNTEYDIEEFNDTWNSVSKINLTVKLLTR